jgi:general secretion pathway protein E
MSSFRIPDLDEIPDPPAPPPEREPEPRANAAYAQTDLRDWLADSPLIRYLSNSQKLTQAHLERLSRLEPENTTPAGLLLKLGMVSEREIADAFSMILGSPLAEPRDFPPEPLFSEQLSSKFLKESMALPLEEREGKVLLVMADPENEYSRRAFELALGRRVIPVAGIRSEIEAGIDKLYARGKTALGQIAEDLGHEDDVRPEDIEHLRDMASEAPVVKMVNLIVNRAVDTRASDIHIEPFENRLKVRYRIDGVLREVEAPPARSTAAVISRIKIMAKLNIAERRLPQDGRIQLRQQGRELDVRVSTVPTMHGESVVMRLLDRKTVVLDFPSLGFTGKTLTGFVEALQAPHGIILVTGPTGSGKTTTLYTALDKLNTPERKILTVEDPVEYQLVGINQIQVNPQIDLTFANALRSFLRQDPDVIMVGEMRDVETARIAVQASLTGHLVLSTIHTNDAGGSVARLLDMGVENYLLCSTLRGILAQRLVRVLCKSCREKTTAEPEVVARLQLERFTDVRPITLYRTRGCQACSNIGYRGRMAIMEFMPMTDAVRRLVMQQADANAIERAAVSNGMQTMYEDGMRKALDGTTTIEEVLRVSQEAESAAV